MGTGALIAILIAAIALVVFLIVAVKMHASMALLLAAFGVAIVAGVPLNSIPDILEKGVGGTLGFLTLIIGFGAVLGKLLEESGGAERLASTMLNVIGKNRATVVMALLGLIAGITVFVEVGFVLLVPLVFVIAKEAGISRIKVGIPLAVSLMIVHCILPPHPAATAIAGVLGADIGKVIPMGLLIALPASLIAGPLFTRLTMPARGVVRAGVSSAPAESSSPLETEKAPADTQSEELPGFTITLFTILLPLLIMIIKTVSTYILDADSLAAQILSIIGNPISALLLSVLFAYFSLGFAQGRTITQLSALTDGSFAPIAGVLLIIGAGGAFNEVLKESGVAPALSDALSELPISPIILAWLIALVLHFAVGSATVAMISAAGIVLPLLPANPGLSPEILALAVGSGAIGLTHVTDSLFWLVKELLGMSVPQALKTITVSTSIASVLALLGTLALSTVL